MYTSKKYISSPSRASPDDIGISYIYPIKFHFGHNFFSKAFQDFLKTLSDREKQDLALSSERVQSAKKDIFEKSFKFYLKYMLIIIG